MYDGANVILKGYENLLKDRPEIFSKNFEKGEVYNNGSRGIDCATRYPVSFWEHGPIISKYLRDVSAKVPVSLFVLSYSVYRVLHEILSRSLKQRSKLL